MMTTASHRSPGLGRREFVTRLTAQLPDALFVTGLGSSSYDVFAAGDRPLNYYLWGAMGGAVPLALGLALARPERSVVVITGDGEQLMGIGSLATVAAKQPANLSIVVLDNGHYGETGMQRSHTSLGTDLVAVAKGFGIAQAWAVHEIEQADDIAQRALARNGPCLAQVFVETSDLPKALPPRDGAYLRDRFRGALGLQPL